MPFFGNEPAYVGKANPGRIGVDASGRKVEMELRHRCHDKSLASGAMIGADPQHGECGYVVAFVQMRPRKPVRIRVRRLKPIQK